jgi:hypothetical protein
MTEKEFDYSWDDQDPDQMNNLVAGEYSSSPDLEDHTPVVGMSHCTCRDESTDLCEDCGHSIDCFLDSSCSH